MELREGGGEEGEGKGRPRGYVGLRFAQAKVQYRAVSIDMQVAAAKLPLSTKALSVSLFFSPRLPPPAVSPSRAFLRGSRRGEHRLNKAEASGLLEQFLRAGHY